MSAKDKQKHGASSVWLSDIKSLDKRKEVVYKARRTASGRMAAAPARLEQDRWGEGDARCTPEEREAKLMETLAKSLRLTSQLVRCMDKDSGGESEEEEELSLAERRRRRKEVEQDGESDRFDKTKGPLSKRLPKRKRKPDRPVKEDSESDDEIALGERVRKRKINPLKVVDREIDNWEELFEHEGRQFEGRSIDVEQPVLVTGGVMKDYQLAGLKWITSLRKLGANGILADEMGLGKTLQTIALFCRLYESERDAGPFLVIAPLSTISNWQREVRRFAPAAPCHLLYPKREAQEKWWSRLEETTACEQLGGRQIGSIFITSYDTAIALRTMLDQVKWNFIVVDEGHRIKNRKCRLTKYLKTFQSTGRLLLTGTPMQNNMGELWSLLNFIQPDIFDDYEIFELWFNAKSLHEDEDEKARLVAQEDKKSVLSSIHRIIGPFLLRRVKAEVELSIPPKTEVMVYCPFTEAQATQYNYFQQLLIRTKAKHAKDRPEMGNDMCGWSGQYMSDLRCAVNHPYILDNPATTDQAMIDSCGKLQVLDQMLTCLMQDGHKTLVFSQMTRMIDVLIDYFKMKNIPYCSLDGRMPYLDRQMNVERFTSEPDVMVFLLSTRAGGLGINLVAADTCIIYDSDWNPQQDLQAQDRCHRIGQTKPVMVYRLVTKGTIDQVMVERAQAKRALERLVVHRDKFKSGARNMKSTQRGVTGSEVMKLLMTEEAAASCTARQGAGGLEQEVLDSLMDRSNVQDFREKMELVNGKTPEEMLDEMESAEIEPEKMNRKASRKARGPKAGSKKHYTIKCSDCGKVFKYAKAAQKHKVLNTCQAQKKMREFEFECERCQAGFHSEQELTVHRNIHMGLKPFKCEHCGKGFSYKKSATEHARKAHPSSETLTKSRVNMVEQLDTDIETIILSDSDADEDKPLSKRNKSLHTVQQAALERITCEVCGHKTNTSGGMVAHMKRKHATAPLLDPAPKKEQVEPSTFIIIS